MLMLSISRCREILGAESADRGVEIRTGAPCPEALSGIDGELEVREVESIGRERLGEHRVQRKREGHDQVQADRDHEPPHQPVVTTQPAPDRPGVEYADLVRDGAQLGCGSGDAKT